MGLDIYLRWEGQTEDEKQAQYTGFTTTGEAGYLRSSYNDGGFNSWAERHLGVYGYHHIFGYDTENEQPVGPYDTESDYQPTGFFPDWDASRQRAQAMLEQARTLDNLTVIRVDTPVRPKSEYPERDGVLAAYRERVARGSSFETYSNWLGLFTAKPFIVKAVMWQQGYFGLEPVLIVEHPEAHVYYIDSLEQCLKFIDLGQRKQGWLVWSG